MAKKYHIDLNEMPNDGCSKKCPKEKRQKITDDDICKVTKSVLDDLPVRCVGEWSYEKIYYLTQYFGIFAQGMKSRWNGLNYIEICCGLGRCVLRKTGLEIDGTSLAVLKHKHFNLIKKALFIDVGTDVIDILNKRIHAVLGKGINAQAREGDYNIPRGIGDMLGDIGKDCLNLVFIDPTNCDVPFDTIKQIVAVLNNVDFIFNVAVGTDANRNLVSATLDKSFSKVKQKYIKFLGVDDFFENKAVVDAAQRGDNKKLRKLFLDEYKMSLEKIGYSHFGVEQIKHYYHLLFASRNKKGLEFWDKAHAITPSNQRKLPL